MSTSQNGWPVISRGQCIGIKVAGGTIPVRCGDVAVVFGRVLTRWHNEVERLVFPGCWGYCYRAVKGQNEVLSNHASATAVDVNAPLHPLAKRGTYSPKQVKAIRRILADCDGCIGWGGDYQRRADEMHLEISGTAAAVHALANRIREEDQDMTPDQMLDVLRSPAGKRAIGDAVLGSDTIENPDSKVRSAKLITLRTAIERLEAQREQIDRMEGVMGNLAATVVAMNVTLKNLVAPAVKK